MIKFKLLGKCELYFFWSKYEETTTRKDNGGGLTDRHWLVPGRAPRRWPRRRARQRRPPQGLLRRLSRSAPLLGSCSCSSRGRGVGRRQTPIKTTGCSGCAPLPLALGGDQDEKERARAAAAIGVSIRRRVRGATIYTYIDPGGRTHAAGGGGRPRSSRARIHKGPAPAR